MLISRSDSDSSRRIYVRSALRSLNFKSFQRLVMIWLGSSGYHRIRPLNRSHRRGRGSLGPDFLVQVGDDGLDVAVQIRHWTSSLSKRVVDELRGLLLRDQIPAGMIVCPTTVSRAARVAAVCYGGRPIRLVGIESLADSLIAHDLGTPEFFRTVRALSSGSDQRVRPMIRKEPSEATVNPDGPGPDRTSWLAAGALLVLLVLWLITGVLG